MAETDKLKDEPAADEAEKKRFESEIETVGPCKVEVRITVPAETIREEMDERYAEIIRTVAFPGFRVGHAPRRLVEKKLGEEVLNDVKEGLLGDSFKDAIETHDLDPIDEPDVDLEGLELDPDKPLEYKAVLLVRPTVTIPDFEKITVTAAKPEVTDEMVEETIEELRKRHAVLEAAPDGTMAEGDVAVVDFRADLGDEKLKDAENAEYHHPAEHLVGLPVPGLPDAILGKKTGEEFTLTETLPDAWPLPEQAGQEFEVQVTVNDVKRHTLPELDDAFAEELDYDSMDEVREEIRAQVERGAEQGARRETDRRIVDALLEAAPIELPEDVVREEITRRIDRKKAILRMQGVDEEEMEKQVSEAMSAEKDEVEREFRAGFLLQAISKDQKIFVTESEIEERIAQMAAGYNRSVDEMKEYLDQRDMMGSIRSGMREEKVMELLRGKVNIEEAE